MATTSSKSLEAPDLQKRLAFTTSRLPGQSLTTCGGTRTRLLHPHFRFIRQRRFRVVRPRVCWIQGVTFGKPRMVAGHVLRPSKRRVTSPFLGIHATGILVYIIYLYLYGPMDGVGMKYPPPLLREMMVLECSGMFCVQTFSLLFPEKIRSQSLWIEGESHIRFNIHLLSCSWFNRQPLCYFEYVKPFRKKKKNEHKNLTAAEPTDPEMDFIHFHSEMRKMNGFSHPFRWRKLPHAFHEAVKR